MKVRFLWEMLACVCACISSDLTLSLATLDLIGEDSFETTVPLHPVQGSPLETPSPGSKVIQVLSLSVFSCLIIQLLRSSSVEYNVLGTSFHNTYSASFW